MTDIDIETRQDPHLVIARLSGDVDLAGTPGTGGRILDAVSNEAAGLVVDLTHVRYLDSAGIQMLFEFARRLESGRQAVAVVVPDTSPLRTLFDMTGVRQAMAVCPTEADAVVALSAGAVRRY